MDSDTVLLAASLACGGNSDELHRWLHQQPADPNILLHPQHLTACRIRQQSAERLLEWLDGDQLQPLSRQLNEAGWQWLAPEHTQWPVLLNDIDDPPAVLFVRGNRTLLNSPQLAIVGARHASTEGLDNARRFARALAASGFTITSGLALGIDGAAHRGALQSGKTVAVLGHGPGPCYPSRHRPLAEQIVDHDGLLVTEFPPGLTPRREFFPQRNRLISGLSLATIVIEAAEHSGSLITARLASQQGREVFAMPGSIHNPLSKGCHRLLRDGANWLESEADILSAFSSLTALAQSTTHHTDEAPATEHPLLQFFISGANNMDQLQERSGLAVQTLAQQLSELELNGSVVRVAGGYARRRHHEHRQP
ncbi:MAG: DNA-protecting protein DprA [Gammaproteobacteria bacterium HGW-Gammaproteobacteria-14]|nr:MAG: DNA-protecting protein DprA [Gammaproteobacteria bacterium HGW-Gammaproteobacteria-14]